MTTGRLLARRTNGLVSSFRAAATAAAAAGGRQPWGDCQGRQQQRRLSSRYFSSISATPDEGLVFTGEAPSDYDGSAVVYPNVISAEDQATILQDLQAIFGRRRYEKGHWDAVIVKYKETELWEEETSGQHQQQRLSDTSQAVLEGLRSLLITRQHVPAADGSPVRWLAPHAIELHPEGELRAHVDSTRFSGGLVAGLSLGTPSIMRLQHPTQEEGDKDAVACRTERIDGHVDLFLPPRSLYALTRRSRYEYTHELLPDNVVFGGTGASIERKDHRWSVLFRDAKE